ncbi:glycosyltransferase [Rhizobacter sp. Root1221]|uniref:glycosyltransferase n=1 Tax=Rhizobacter sp. Root1221 TaxID=1736433 RepID=UPI0006F891E8|nr:glycosyltransferase [Rhizobacter sp. Root1221]KQV95942.1 glycosyl transferase family 1 [Rhizobacter sp. Root1221]
MRIALIGDGQSPHLLKWARALTATPGVSLWVASSRGFLPAFDGLVPMERRLALGTQANHAGGNVGVLRSLPLLGRWLREVDADWLNPHYLTSHGTLAWLAKRFWRLRARIVGSAWGSDILVTPSQSAAYRLLTRRVLRACALCTSDSSHMTERMQVLGAGEVMTFPFGLEAMPPAPGEKVPWLFFANRGLEPLYQPDRVLVLFSRVLATHPEARLVVANGGSLRGALEHQALALGIAHAVQFVGRLDAATQAGWYDRAQWYVSLPASDSVAVSVLEAMAHGCIPLLSDLPANRELVRDGDNGRIVTDTLDPVALGRLLPRGAGIAAANRAWVSQHALFPPAVGRLLDRLNEWPPA